MGIAIGVYPGLISVFSVVPGLCEAQLVKVKQLLSWLRIEWMSEAEGEIAAYICLQLFQSGHLDSE